MRNKQIFKVNGIFEYRALQDSLGSEKPVFVRGLLRMRQIESKETFDSDF